jgi:pimeloyl-ACP methyl ester carboxylesterase
VKGKPILTAVGALAAATGAAAAINNALSRKAPQLWPAIPAPQGDYDWDGGRVHYYCAGEGDPVVLLHSHNAAASAYEMKQAFRELSADHLVFTVDLPGYGLSERVDRPYYAQTYVRFLHDFVLDVVQRPAVLIASSVSGAHALLAAAEDPRAFSHIVVASPTGLHAGNVAPPGAVRALSKAAGLPVWGQALYNGIVSKASIRRTLEHQVYYNPWAVTHEMVEYAWATSHQPNAVCAPYGFLNGDVWADARAAYAGIRLPLLAIWGDHDRMNPFEASEPDLCANPDARVVVIPECGAAPYDEKPAEFAAIVRDFLGM